MLLRIDTRSKGDNLMRIGTLLLGACAACVSARGQSGRQALQPVPLQQVTVEDEFWTPKRTVWQQVTIRDAFTKFENDRGGAINNFDRVRDGLRGNHAGPPWYDGLIYEMIRGSSDFLAAHPDPELDHRLDGYIARIAAAAAKSPNGYMNTYTQLEEPGHEWGFHGGYQRWQHEVYNAGALVDAAIHHYRATGKTAFLNVAVKFANYMSDLMGPPPKKNIVPAHPLPEEALTKLYLLFRDNPKLKAKLSVPVNEAAYLKLAEFWIENRGVNAGLPDWTNWDNKKAEDWIRAESYGDSRPSWGSYAQDDKPTLQQQTIEGHAVRATLLWTGVAAVSAVNGRQDYVDAAERIWKNLSERRMAITGGTGAFAKDEKFGPDYVLPNNAYLETCAAVGAGFFHLNMGLLEGDRKYFDELGERVLYNGALSGVSIAGDTYFYENPLEGGTSRTRWVWHNCPCCPPMFLKMMGAMPRVTSMPQTLHGLYVNLFVGSRAKTRVGETNVAVTQTTRYPWDGTLKVVLEPDYPAEFDLSIRVPGVVARSATMKINGQLVVNLDEARRLRPCAPQLETRGQGGNGVSDAGGRVKAHPLVDNNTGRVALMRGPVVYCLESADNGDPVRTLAVPPRSPTYDEVPRQPARWCDGGQRQRDGIGAVHLERSAIPALRSFTIAKNHGFHGNSLLRQYQSRTGRYAGMGSGNPGRPGVPGLPADRRPAFGDNSLRRDLRQQVVVPAQVDAPTGAVRYEPLSVMELVRRGIQGEIVIAVVLDQGYVPADFGRVHAHVLPQLAHPVMGDNFDPMRRGQIRRLENLRKSACPHVRLDVAVDIGLQKRDKLFHHVDAFAVRHRRIGVDFEQRAAEFPVILDGFRKDLLNPVHFVRGAVLQESHGPVQMAGVSIVGVRHDVEIPADRFARGNEGLGIADNAGFARQPLRRPAHLDLEGAIAVALDGFRNFAHGVRPAVGSDVHKVERSVVAIHAILHGLAEELVDRLSAQFAYQVQQDILEPRILRLPDGGLIRGAEADDAIVLPAKDRLRIDADHLLQKSQPGSRIATYPSTPRPIVPSERKTRTSLIWPALPVDFVS